MLVSPLIVGLIQAAPAGDGGGNGMSLLELHQGLMAHNHILDLAVHTDHCAPVSATESQLTFFHTIVEEQPPVTELSPFMAVDLDIVCMMGDRIPEPTFNVTSLSMEDTIVCPLNGLLDSLDISKVLPDIILRKPVQHYTPEFDYFLFKFSCICAFFVWSFAAAAAYRNDSVSSHCLPHLIRR
ncbi:hypothetical protein HDZ31DRAFT_68088 [Schizophyllum fasciatum]